MNSSNRNIDAKNCYEYFKSLSNPEDISLTPDEDVYEYLVNFQWRRDESLAQCMKNYIMELNEGRLKKAIMDLECGQAAGYDMLINKLYKYILVKHLYQR